MVTDTSTPYNVPEESAEVLAYLASDARLNIPEEVQRIAGGIQFEGTAEPILPVPFKFAEAMAGLKGLEAAFVLAIAQQRYSLRSEATVSTDLAALYVTSAFTTRLNGHMGHDSAMKDLVTDTDIHDSYKHPWRQLCTNIYRTRTGRYYHTHGSLDALASMGVLGLDHARVDENKDRASILNKYQEAVGQWDPDELDIAVNEGAKQAGVPCYSWDEFTDLEQGKAIINCPVYELSCAAKGDPAAWPEGSSSKGALSGLKVLELTRIIAGPAVGRGLAEHGATVLRIVSEKLPDLMTVHPAMNHGKYVANLDLKTEAGKAKLTKLIADCDVFIDGYRPGALARLGFSRDAVRALAPNAVYVRENTYGFHGPWAERSGWQQIADGLVGVADAFGRRLGLGDELGTEPVVPLFPNADFGCGEAGVVGVLHALYLRANQGGAYNVDVALAYYNLFIMHLGEYDDPLWNKIRPTVKLDHNSDMTFALPAILPSLTAKHPTLFTSPQFWHTVPAPSYGKGSEVTAPLSAVRIDGLKIGNDRGPVQNGSDEAEWQ